MKLLRSRPSRTDGFTLIELMVVAAIIATLVALMVPGIKGILQTSQATQAENSIRASLMSARSYAMYKGVITGIRFQDDGMMVVVCQNTAAQGLATYQVDRVLKGWVYQMMAVPGYQPLLLPDAYRVTAKEAESNQVWRVKDSGGNSWFFDGGHNPPQPLYQSCVSLFSPDGRGMLASCVFPNGWYPLMTGSALKWLGTVQPDGMTPGPNSAVYAPQSGHGIHYPSSQLIKDSTADPATGPSVTIDLRLYNYAVAKGYLAVGQLVPTPPTANDTGITTNGVQTWSADANLSMGMNAILGTASDFMIDPHSGAILRQRAGMNASSF